MAQPPEDGSTGGGCGVQGCLFAAVALFVVLLIALLVISVIRFSSPPQPRFGMPTSPGAAATAASALEGMRASHRARSADLISPAHG